MRKFPNCPNAEISNFFGIDKNCCCGWGKVDDENVLNINKIKVEDLICPVCKLKSYYQYPLINCSIINKLCHEYDCELYK